MKRSIVNIATPQFEYQLLSGAVSSPHPIPPPETITLLIDSRLDSKHWALRPGEVVKTGQKLRLAAHDEAHAICSAGGTIASVDPFVGDNGKQLAAVSIALSQTDIHDEGFAAVCEHPELHTACNYIACLPGKPNVTALTDQQRSITALVINGLDKDLFIVSAQHVLATQMKAVVLGIQRLKTLTGIDDVILATPRDVLQGFGHIGATALAVDTTYPAGMPRLIAQKLLGRELAAGKDPLDEGLYFMDVETVAAVGRSFDSRRMDMHKTVTLIDKGARTTVIRALIGTPIRDILAPFDIRLANRDRLIVGGPMTGRSIYADTFPIDAATDAIMVQDKDDTVTVSDYPCINCGDCIRVCPARIPVNLLVRFLEAGQYETAEQDYDLSACLECGLCNFVCVSKIPILQYIKLAKHELGRLATEESLNE